MDNISYIINIIKDIKKKSKVDGKTFSQTDQKKQPCLACKSLSTKR